MYSDNIEQDFARVLSAYESELFKPYLYGSVQPFIRIDDLRTVLLSLVFINAKSLTMLNEVSKSIDLLVNKVDKLRELKKSIVQCRVLIIGNKILPWCFRCGAHKDAHRFNTATAQWCKYCESYPSGIIPKMNQFYKGEIK